jgi:hypothetical protein
MSQESKQERREMRDRFAIAAMQSLIRVFATIDVNGVCEKRPFKSIVGVSWKSALGWSLELRGEMSAKEVLAYDAYEIAEAMMDMRSEINLEEDRDEETEETTEESKSAANQSRRGNDGSTVLGVPAVEPAAGESQVGSDQQACSERLQESQPER